MTNQAAQFVGTIPENYDRGLGPHVFVDYAADLTRRVTSTSPNRVLEMAAGSGIVTRMLRDALPASTHLLASDLNPPMLEVARKKFKAGEKADFQPADATALPFEDAAFDAVVCQFGVMFFPDKDKSYREVYRVLSPGGCYLFNVWDARSSTIHLLASRIRLSGASFRPMYRASTECRSAITRSTRSRHRCWRQASMKYQPRWSDSKRPFLRQRS